MYDATKEHKPFARSAQPLKEHPNKAAARAKRREELRKAKAELLAKSFDITI